MASQYSGIEGMACGRPPLFDGSNYGYWKTRMSFFINAIDFDLWTIIENGYEPPMVEVNGVSISKQRAIYTREEKRKAELNAKAVNALFCALSPTEYNRVCTCRTAKEIWDKLEVTHEGTENVKESKVDILNQEFELFTMKDNETIKQMYSRYNDIVSGLKGLGKEIPNVDLNRKLLRSLPENWMPISAAIKESSNFKTLKLDELVGTLITYELTLSKQQEMKKKKEKNIALQIEQRDSSSSSSSSSKSNSNSEDEAMISRRYKRYLKNKARKGKKSIEDKTNKSSCYSCEKPGHTAAECKKKEGEKKKKKNKKAISRSYSSSSSSDEEYARICLMAMSDDKANSSNEDEVNFNLFNDNKLNASKEELHDALNDALEDLDALTSKNRKLEKKVCKLYEEIGQMQEDNTKMAKENDECKARISKLNATNNALSMQMNELINQVKAKNSMINKNEIIRSKAMKKVIHQLGPKTKAYDKVFRPIEQRIHNERCDIGYHQHIAQRKHQGNAKKRASFNAYIRCYNCHKVGHAVANCHWKTKAQNENIKIWIPKGFKNDMEGPKQIWVPKTFT
jgi:hypothetical protein